MDSRQQRFTARHTSSCEVPKLKAVHDYHSSGAPRCRVITKDPERGWEADIMHWSNPDKAPAVKTVILSEDTPAKREAIRWVREREAKVGTGIWMWWTDRSQSDDGRVGTARMCKHGDCCTAICSQLGTGRMEVYDGDLWPIRLTLWE